jgi:hypothetical protein
MLWLNEAMAGGAGAVATALGGEAIDPRFTRSAQQGLTVDSRGFMGRPVGLNEKQFDHQSA